MNFNHHRVHNLAASRIRKKLYLIALGWIIFSNFLKLPSQTQVSQSPVRKVLLISIDTLRADYLGCYNSKVKVSPNLDRFAAENILFTRVTSQAPSTAISHKSLLYSLYPAIHKSSAEIVPKEELDSPLQRLQAHGFKTAAFVGGGQLSRNFGFAKGFDTYWEAGSYSDKDSRESLETLEEKVSDWLDSNYRDMFFLFVHSYEMHCPYYPPKEYRDEYASWYQGEIDPRGKCGDSFYNLRALSNEDLRFIRDLYAAQLKYVDEFIQSIFQKLRTLGIYDETMIIFLSDHGESLGERGYIGHNFLYDIQLRIPLIIRIPGVTARKIVSPVEAIDVMPTIFNLLHVSPPYVFQGRNLVPVIVKQNILGNNRTLISEQSAKIRIRKGDVSAVFWRDGNESPEVYNLENDSEETDNVAKDYPIFLRQCRIDYMEMVKGAQFTASKFLIKVAAPPDLNDETREQLKALGYTR